MYKNVHYITAGAGAGKTTSLVGTITRLVAEGADPQRMILTTFTDAAATEFRERSKAGLPSDKAVAMNAAQMGTLHSIAGHYINRYWYLLGIAPSVKPISESMSEILMNRSLEDRVTGEQKAMLDRYAETFGITDGSEGYDYDFWKGTLTMLFAKMRGYGFGKDRIPEFRKRTMDLLRETFSQERNAALLAGVRPCLERYLTYGDVVAANASDAGKKQYMENCKQVHVLLSVDPLAVDVRTLKSFGKDVMKWGRPITLKGPVKDQYEAEIAACKEEVAAAAQMLSETLVHAEYTLILEVAELLFDIMEDWMDAYVRIKNENGVIDFADMEELFFQLLHRDEVLEDISKSVDYLFVDEFQDSSPIQAQIYDILSNHVRQSWFVGDRKQAIYGFAGSDAGLIAELTASFPQEEADPASISGFRKDANGNSSQVLGTSYRSVPGLVAAANDIFIPAFSSAASARDVIPAQFVRLNPAPGKADNAWDALYHVDAGRTVRGKEKLDEDALATFICQMVDSPEFGNAGYGLSDIAVLTRSKYQAKAVGRALKRKKIRTAFVDPDGFQDTPEVALVLAILRLSAGIDVPRSRAEIRKLVCDEDLATLTEKIAKGENGLDGLPGLEEFARSIRPHSVADRINEIITRFDLYGVCGQWDNPDVRRGTLNLLRTAVDEYSDMSRILCSAADVRGFLSFLEDYHPDPKFDNGAEGVKILTYHKSKGLEWKIVILCGLDEYKDEVSIGGVSVLGESTHPESILAIPRLPDKEWVAGCIRTGTGSRDIMASREAVKQGEEKRLLYVGFTRAKEVVVTAAAGVSPEVIGRLCPTAGKRSSCAPAGDRADIWGVGVLSRYALVNDQEGLEAAAGAAPLRYRDAGLFLPARQEGSEETVKYHSPSLYRDPAVQARAQVHLAKDFGRRTDIPHGGLDDDVFGDCVHHVFAACLPGRPQENLSVAARTLGAFGIGDASAPASLTDCLETFFAWLTATYGPAIFVGREVPFRYADAEGRVFSGSMDLVWGTEDGDVLVDYKTFPGRRSELTDPAGRHWAGQYASQLHVYAAALASGGRGKLRASLLFYPVEGLVLEVSD